MRGAREWRAAAKAEEAGVEGRPLATRVERRACGDLEEEAVGVDRLAVLLR